MSVPQTDMGITDRVCEGCKKKFITREAFERKLCMSCEAKAADLLVKVNNTPVVKGRVLYIND